MPGEFDEDTRQDDGKGTTPPNRPPPAPFGKGQISRKMRRLAPDYTGTPQVRLAVLQSESVSNRIRMAVWV